MAVKQGTRNKKLSAFAVIGFILCLITLVFNSGLKIPVLHNFITWPNALYTYIIFPFAYYLGGYVFCMAFFAGSHYSTPSWVQGLLTVLSIVIFILILFSAMLYLQNYTPVGNIVRISLSKTVYTTMIRLMKMHVLLFSGGIFLYHAFL